MIGRLLRLALLFTLMFIVIRWLFSRDSRRGIHDFIKTLAIALLLSSVIFFVLRVVGIHI